MLIRVLYNDDNWGYVKPHRLHNLIESRAIISFYRGEGELVVVGSSAVRSAKPGNYNGPERRRNYGEKD